MLKQIFIINKDLKMGMGKCCSQVAHGEVMYVEEIMKRINIGLISNMSSNYNEWRAEILEDPIGFQKKVVLKSTESEIRDIYIKLKFLNIWCYMIFDKGLTQVAPNSLTCLVVEPLEE